MPQLTPEERVDRLESIDAIKRLKAVYCMYCDVNTMLRICSLFIEDGVWDGGPVVRPLRGSSANPQLLLKEFPATSFSPSPCAQPIIGRVALTADGCTCHTALNDAGTAEGRWLYRV
jgi:hypothetical protein